MDFYDFYSDLEMQFKIHVQRIVRGKNTFDRTLKYNNGSQIPYIRRMDMKKIISECGKWI